MLKVAYKNKQEIRKESVQELKEILDKEIGERDKKQALKFFEKHKDKILAIRAHKKETAEDVSTPSNARKG